MRGGLFGVPGLGRRIRGFFEGPEPSAVNYTDTDSQVQTKEFGSGLASGARTVGSTLGAAGTAVGSAVGSAGRATFDIMKAQGYLPQPNFNNGMKQVNKYRKAQKAQNAINAFNAYQQNYSRISKNNATSPKLKQLSNAFEKARNNTANAAWRNSQAYLDYLNRVNKPKAQQVRNRLAAKAAAAPSGNLLNMGVPVSNAARASVISNLFGPNQAASAMAAVNSAAAARAATAAASAANAEKLYSGLNDPLANRAAANAAQAEEAYEAALTAKDTACAACDAAEAALNEANVKRFSSRRNRRNRRGNNRRSRKSRKNRR